MNIDDLRKYQEMQFDGTLVKYSQSEYEAQQKLVRQAYPMREFERRAALLGYSQSQHSQSVVLVAQAVLAYQSRRFG